MQGEYSRLVAAGFVTETVEVNVVQLVCTEVELVATVVEANIVTVGVTVVVACGPTESEKSRWNAIGSASPLFEISMTDRSPLAISSFSIGHVES